VGEIPSPPLFGQKALAVGIANEYPIEHGCLPVQEPCLRSSGEQFVGLLSGRSADLEWSWSVVKRPRRVNVIERKEVEGATTNVSPVSDSLTSRMRDRAPASGGPSVAPELPAQLFLVECFPLDRKGSDREIKSEGASGDYNCLAPSAAEKPRFV